MAGRVLVGLDTARRPADGSVRREWQSRMVALERQPRGLPERLEDLPLARVVTDIDRDGLAPAPDLKGFAECAVLRTPVFASGGICGHFGPRSHSQVSAQALGLCRRDRGRALLSGALSILEAVRHAMVRVIPCLDVDRGGRQGVEFAELRDAGDPVELAPATTPRAPTSSCCFDITASSDERSTMLHVVERRLRRSSSPYRSAAVPFGRGRPPLLRAGADKVAVNSAAVAAPKLIALWQASSGTVRRRGDRRPPHRDGTIGGLHPCGGVRRASTGELAVVCARLSGRSFHLMTGRDLSAYT